MSFLFAADCIYIGVNISIKSTSVLLQDSNFFTSHQFKWLISFKHVGHIFNIFKAWGI